MITCPACGTDNREWASHCGECGKPLPDGARPRPSTTDAPQAERLPEWLRRDVDERARTSSASPGAPARRGSDLPPIPDGGLAGAMPSWLAGSRGEALDAPASIPPTGQRPGAASDAPDVTTFLSPEDLPAWLRRLAETETSPAESPDDRLPAPAGASIRPIVGNEPVEILFADERVSSTTPNSAELTDPRMDQDQDQDQSPARLAGTPRGDDASPAPAPVADRRLTAAILAGVAIAAMMIAYAVYLGVAG
ncbi:MAG: hypothetical protein ACRDJW_06160 [Thermomicrobiales bacterium]